MVPFHPWAVSGRPICRAHSDVAAAQRPSQPEDGTVAADNAPLCVAVCTSFGDRERLKLLFGSKTVYGGGGEGGKSRGAELVCQFMLTVNDFFFLFCFFKFLLFCTHVLTPVYKVQSFVRMNVCF